MTDLVKIVDCLAYQPKDRLDLIELSEKFNTDADFLKNKTGFLKVARKSPEQTASDLAEKAVLLEIFWRLSKNRSCSSESRRPY